MSGSAPWSAETTDGALIAGVYRLGELLGVGGTASVYAADRVPGGADDLATGAGGDVGERLAIKLLHPHLCADEATGAAFLREARRTSVLEHPNIVRVHDAGVHDAGGVLMPWIALDLLDGPTLADWVDATGPLAPADAIAMAEGLLAGLGHAHAAGLVHRDLSPANIILAGLQNHGIGARITADCVRILDFGLSQVTGRTAVGGDVLLARTDGETDHIVGNAAYMSPEAAQGLPVRSVSDLYQAGAVLYFSLTGQAPFPRPSTSQMLRAHVDAPTPVPSVLAPAAGALDRIVTTAMAKTPARRFRDAAAFVTALEEVAVRVDPPPVPIGQSARTEVLGAGQSSAALAAETDPSHLDDAVTRLYPVADDRPAPDYLAAAVGAEQAPTARPPGVRAGTALLVAVAVVAVAGIGLFAATAVPEPAPTQRPSVAPTEEPSPPAEEPSPPPTESPPPTVAPITTVSVPTLHGTLAEAEVALRAVGLSVGAITRVESASAADTLLSQHPAAGESMPPGGAVALTVASGSNVIPQLTGLTLAAATAQLESHGFRGMAQPLDGPTTAIVVRTEPSAGAVMRLGVTVTLVLQPTPPDPTVAPGTPPPETPEPEAGLLARGHEALFGASPEMICDRACGRSDSGGSDRHHSGDRSIFSVPTAGATDHMRVRLG